MYRSAFRRLRLTQPFHLLQQQRLGLSTRYQVRGYAKSAGHHNDGAKGQRLLQGTSANSNSRSFMTLGIPAALLGVVGLATFVRYNDERRSIQIGKGGKEAIAVKGPTIGGPFTLMDTKRQTFTEKDLMGNWVLLYFGYTSSPDVGPAEVQKMAKAIDILESQQNVKILPVFVTIDPQRDSLSQLDAYLREFDSRIVGLTGPVYSIRQMAQEYRVFFKRVDENGTDYLIDSSHKMYLMSPNLEMVRCFGTEYGAQELAEVIAKVVKRSLHE